MGLSSKLYVILSTLQSLYLRAEFLIIKVYISCVKEYYKSAIMGVMYFRIVVGHEIVDFIHRETLQYEFCTLS